MSNQNQAQQQVENIPQGAEVITIEICENCQEHAWCTQHDEAKYQAIFQQCKTQLEAHPEQKFYVLRNMNHQKQRIQPQRGAFEIKHNGVLIYSKLSTTLFPNPSVINERVSKFFQDKKQGGDLSKYASSSEKKQQPPPKPRDQAAIYGTYYVAVQKEKERLAQLQIEQEEKRRLKEEEDEKRRIEEEKAEKLRQEQEELERIQQEELERQQREEEEEERRRQEEEERQLRLEQERQELLAQQEQEQLQLQQQQQQEQQKDENKVATPSHNKQTKQ